MAGLVDTAEEFGTEKAAEMEKPEAKVIHVCLKEVSLYYITYNAKVTVTNPYSSPVPISEISYTLKTANRFVILFPFHFHYSVFLWCAHRMAKSLLIKYLILPAILMYY